MGSGKDGLVICRSMESLKGTVLALVIVWTCLVCSVCGTRPNIVIFFVDDVSDTSAVGSGP